MNLVACFDGLCEPYNPGGCGAWGCVLWVGTKQKYEEFGYLGQAEWMSNNWVYTKAYTSLAV